MEAISVVKEKRRRTLRRGCGNNKWMTLRTRASPLTPLRRDNYVVYDKLTHIFGNSQKCIGGSSMYALLWG